MTEEARAEVAAIWREHVRLVDLEERLVAFSQEIQGELSEIVQRRAAMVRRLNQLMEQV